MKDEKEIKNRSYRSEMFKTMVVHKRLDKCDVLRASGRAVASARARTHTHTHTLHARISVSVINCITRQDKLTYIFGDRCEKNVNGVENYMFKTVQDL